MENMRFALGILKVWSANDTPSTRWANLPEHFFLGVGLIQKIGPTHRTKLNTLTLHQSGGAERLGGPNKIGQAHCEPRMLHECLRDGGLETPQNKWWY
jgi:hypothetical protein